MKRVDIELIVRQHTLEAGNYIVTFYLWKPDSAESRPLFSVRMGREQATREYPIGAILSIEEVDEVKAATICPKCEAVVTCP